jgi:exopolysaccharide biosynthesis predicted pyruvyltransferase EpsI
MEVVIIHRQQRTDRIPIMAGLLNSFPKARILEAKVPLWETDLHSRAMRGCAVSHLSAVKAFLTENNPLLVLEDDAKVLTDLPDLSKIPSDAGIIVCGGDINVYGDDYGSGFREVLPPFYGTQAVIYLPRLLKSNYLLNAFERMATAPMGSGEGRVCTESLLLLTAKDSGLKIYRPNNMVFGTVPSLSDSRGIVEERKLALKAEERDGLLPANLWNKIFSPYSGKKAHLLYVPGNPGDLLINAATRQLFKNYNITESNIGEADVLMWPGGGNVGGQYNFTESESIFLNFNKEKIILPQSIIKNTKLLQSANRVWLRDDESLKIFPSGERAPDLALAYRSSIKPSDVKNKNGVFFRNDYEKTVIPQNNFGDPAFMVENHYDYLQLANNFSFIKTNRLHFAVAGLIMRKEVTLVNNSYHKNYSAWQAELKNLGCKFEFSN